MRKFLISMSALVFLFSVSVSAVHAQITTDQTGLYTTGDDVYGTTTGDTDIGTYIGTYIVTPVLAISGTICLISILYAGFLWMSAMGDAKQVTKAKDLMLNTFIGLILTLAAYGITQFLFTSLT
jgi:uncharacterized membrane protein